MVVGWRAPTGRGAVSARADADERRRASSEDRRSSRFIDVGLPESGRMASSTPSLERHACAAMRRTRCSRRGSTRVQRSRRRAGTAARRCGRRSAGAADREQRAQVARRAVRARARSRTTITSRVAEAGVARCDRGERRRREQEHVGEEVVERGRRGRRSRRRSRRAPRSRAACSASSRSVASFAAGWRSTAVPAATAASSDGGIDRVEVADDEVDARRRARRAWSSPESAAITRSAAGRSCERRAGRWIAAREHERGSARSHDSLRRHYPVQVRGVGDA